MKLTDAKIRSAKPAARPYKLADGRGLTLQVMPHGSKLWRFRYRFQGRESMMSLGCYPDVTLNDARDLLVAARRAVAAGQRPNGGSEEVSATGSRLMQACIDELRDAEKSRQKPGTIKQAHRDTTYLSAKLGTVGIVEVDAPLLVQTVNSLVNERGYACGKRCKNFLKRLFSTAAANGEIPYDVAAGLVMPQQPQKREGRKGITDAKAFGKLLSALSSVPNATVRMGLQLLSLCFTRPMELMQAEWPEFELDSEQPLWTIPAERMKKGLPHTVPLSTQAVKLLRELQALHGNRKYVLTGHKVDKPISHGAFREALDKLGYSGIQQPHGFRVSASTLLHELGYDPEVIETALAHVRPGVAGVYNRSHLLEQRRDMLQAWADHLDKLEGRRKCQRKRLRY